MFYQRESCIRRSDVTREGEKVQKTLTHLVTNLIFGRLCIDFVTFSRKEKVWGQNRFFFGGGKFTNFWNFLKFCDLRRFSGGQTLQIVSNRLPRTAKNQNGYRHTLYILQHQLKKTIWALAVWKQNGDRFRLVYPMPRLKMAAIRDVSLRRRRFERPWTAVPPDLWDSCGFRIADVLCEAEERTAAAYLLFGRPWTPTKWTSNIVYLQELDVHGLLSTTPQPVMEFGSRKRGLAGSMAFVGEHREAVVVF